jgi:hypothetical protein
MKSDHNISINSETIHHRKKLYKLLLNELVIQSVQGVRVGNAGVALLCLSHANAAT